MAVNNSLNLGVTPLPVSEGGTGATTVPSNGQIPVGNGSGYVAANITAGAGISVTNGSGTLTIAATGSGLAWTTIAGTTQTAAVNSGYVVGNAAQTTITLSATFGVGDAVYIKGLGAGGWILTANTGQVIHVGQSATSSGGTVTSAANFDAILIEGLVANTQWSMGSSVTAGFTVA